jgi:molybdenum cofactor cytidylyltransferase
MSQHPGTAAIILAAGRSSRMEAGHHKLLLPLGGHPILIHVIEAVIASQARPILVVLGHQAPLLRDIIANHIDHPDIHLLDNPAYQQGMSTSLHTGIAALSNPNTAQPAFYSPLTQIDSTIILLGDQPLVTPHIINILIETRKESQKRIVAPLYNGKRGNPVLFAADLFPELLQTTGDEGGRSVIQHHRSDLATVEIGSDQPNIDVDTWDVYQQIVVEWQRNHSEEKR